MAACSVHVRGRGVGTNECIIHMRQDAFLPVKEVGLTPHVPGVQGAPLPEIRHDSLHLGVFPVNGVPGKLHPMPGSMCSTMVQTGLKS